MKQIRVIAPVKSLLTLNEKEIHQAKIKLNELGFCVTISEHAREIDDFYSSAVSSRVEDLMNAFLDSRVDIILCAGGGYNGNQLLNELNYEVIKKQYKPFCGFSDNTILTNAIYHKTKKITYLSPNFGNFAMREGLGYTIEYFLKALFKNTYSLKPSNVVSSDNWKQCQTQRVFKQNLGYTVLNEGNCVGKIIGGNLRTFNLLQGTSYMPSLHNSVLFLEDDDIVGEHFPLEFERNLISLTQQNEFRGVRGIVVGTAQENAGMTLPKWSKIFQKKEFKNLPIIINASFGHTTPMATLPIGATAYIEASEKPRIFISKNSNKPLFV